MANDTRRNKQPKLPDTADYEKPFKDIVTYTSQLEAEHSTRIAMQNRMEDMFLMRVKDVPRIRNMKLTLSPDARNKLLGAVRLLVASDPTWEVPREENVEETDIDSDKLELAAYYMFRQSSRMAGEPIHYPMILSGMLYGETHVEISATKDLLNNAKGLSPAAMQRLEDAAEASPYLIETKDPRGGFPVYDHLGLAAFHSKRQVTVQQIIDTYGDAARPLLGADVTNPSKLRWLKVFWNLDENVVWIDGAREPIRRVNHGLPFIPIVANIIEGGSLFQLEVDKRQPFLFAVDQSGIAKRQNLVLSVLYYLVTTIGANPMFVWQRTENSPDQLQVDFSKAGGTVSLGPGEQYTALGKNVIDPSMMEALRLAEQKMDESTIFSQALGEPLQSGSATFSLTSLLNQAGRLPLLVPQRKLSWMLGDVMKIVLRWYAKDGGKFKGQYKGKSLDLKPGDIPKHFEIEARLEVGLPQDELQQATIANMLSAGQDPLMSKRWVRDKFLHAGQSDEMTREIWNEQSASMWYQKLLSDTFQPQGQTNGGVAPPVSSPVAGAQPSIEQVLQQMPPELVQLIQSGQAPQELLAGLARQFGPMWEPMLQMIQQAPMARGTPGTGAPPNGAIPAR